MAINGAAIEALFDFVAMTKGFIVSAPQTDKAQYDRIVDNKGVLHRIQVKARRGKGNFMVRIDKSKNKRYTREDTDFIALYLEHNDSWYIFPVEECKVTFRVTSKLNKYKEKWDLFEKV